MALDKNVRFEAATDIGRVRSHNEDNYLVDRKLGLFVVADGMGGHAAGEVASAIAVRTIHEEVKANQGRIDGFESGAGADSPVSAQEVLALLEAAVMRASVEINAEANRDEAKRGMGTTVSAMLLAGDTGFIAHVGDSRIYLVRQHQAHQVTEDHTVFNELLKRGKMTREQIEQVPQKNAMVRAVGVYAQVQVDTLLLETVPGDAFVLCSDGLYSYIRTESDLVACVESDDDDQGARGLVRLANDRGGNDNVTAIVIRIGAKNTADAARTEKLALKHDVLAKVPLFARLSERELLRVMQVAAVRRYNKGDIVIREGTEGEELFIVLSGTLRVSRGGTDLSTLFPGDHVGEMALLRRMPRSATVHSEEPSELITISRSEFFDLLRREHELAVKLLWKFLSVLADRLDQTSQNLREARAELAFDVDLEETVPTTLPDEDDYRPTIPVPVK